MSDQGASAKSCHPALRAERVAMLDDFARVGFEEFIDALPDIVLLIHPSDGRLLAANAAAVLAYQYTRDELLSLTVYDLRDPALSVQAGAEMARALSSGFRFETIHQRKDGQRFPVEVNSHAITLGRARVLMSVVRDTSERARMLEALREAQRLNREEHRRAEDRLKFFKTAIDQAPLGAYWLDSTGRCVYVNDAACRTLGYTRDELLQMRIIDIARGTEELWQSIFESIKTRGSLTRQSRHYRKDGEPVDVEIASFHLNYGDVDYSIGFATDIRERLRAAREREELQRRFNQAQKMESIGRLAGGIAHDFNNVLMVIQMTTQSLFDRAGAAAAFREDLAFVDSAIKRASALTRQLLTFARRQTIAPQVLNLNDAVTGLLGMLRALLGENLELEWHPQADLWHVSIDPSQIDQLLANLCVNARDAITDVGKVVIRTANRTIDTADCFANPGFAVGEFVELTVADNGCGMDAETLSSIFEPFFTTKPEGKGTGLGLATVYGIVKQNGGFIRVASAAGEGATFSIYLPSFRAGSPAAEQPPSSPRSSSATEHILVVEDEPAILAVLSRMLREAGYTVLAAQSPSEAIQMAAEHWGPIHLLLTDVVLPEMNGRELSKRLTVTRPELKCLFMSGYTADVIGHDGAVEQTVSCISKPFSFDELMTKIRSVLD